MNNMMKNTVFLLLLFTSPFILADSSYEKAWEAYNNKNYELSFELFKQSANENDSDAQYLVGLMLFNGEGVIKNEQKAVEWFKKSALQDDMDAQYYLGFMTRDGIGIKKDEQKAVEWFKKSANQGSKMSQYNLGVMYRDGTGV